MNQTFLKLWFSRFTPQPLKSETRIIDILLTVPGLLANDICGQLRHHFMIVR